MLIHLGLIYEEKARQAVAEGIFENTNILSEDLENEDVVGSFVEKLEKVDESLIGYSEMIDTLMDGNDDLSGASQNMSDSMESGQAMIQNGIDS